VSPLECFDDDRDEFEARLRRCRTRSSMEDLREEFIAIEKSRTRWCAFWCLLSAGLTCAWLGFLAWLKGIL
jgi:hypothetical protein